MVMVAILEFYCPSAYVSSPQGLNTSRRKGRVVCRQHCVEFGSGRGPERPMHELERLDGKRESVCVCVCVHSVLRVWNGKTICCAFEFENKQTKKLFAPGSDIHFF